MHTRAENEWDMMMTMLLNYHRGILVCTREFVQFSLYFGMAIAGFCHISIFFHADCSFDCHVHLSSFVKCGEQKGKNVFKNR